MPCLVVSRDEHMQSIPNTTVNGLARCHAVDAAMTSIGTTSLPSCGRARHERHRRRHPEPMHHARDRHVQARRPTVPSGYRCRMPRYQRTYPERWGRGAEVVIVTCCTCASLRIAPSPPRGIIPKSGGFAVVSVPRPRVPWSRLRRPQRPLLPRPRASPWAPPRDRPRPMPPRRSRWPSPAGRPGPGATGRSSEAQQTS
jgi:hypothetical protein